MKGEEKKECGFVTEHKWLPRSEPTHPVWKGNGLTPAVGASGWAPCEHLSSAERQTRAASAAAAAAALRELCRPWHDHDVAAQGLSGNRSLNLQSEKAPIWMVSTRGEKKKTRKKDLSSWTFDRRNSVNKSSRDLWPHKPEFISFPSSIKCTESCCVLETSGRDACCSNNTN